ncbi:MAG TPA: aminoglycoside phosphotransferase family protein [Patescibacteria group bacterium]
MDKSYIEKIINLRGNIGKKWLNNLPQLIKNFERKWEIKVKSPFPLSYNYVAPAIMNNGESVVLKISFPNNNEFEAETEALKFYNGIGAIKLIKESKEENVLLLEKAQPGIRLREIKSDEEQVSIASNVIKRLHKKIPDSYPFKFPTLADWSKIFERYKEKYSLNLGPIPKKIFENGESIFNELLNDKKEMVLLHGDLHTDNILSSENEWVIIDPKGVIGESEFELGAYLRNPYYDLPKNSNYKEIEINRIVQFAEEFNFDKKRILRWAYASAVISLLWFLEDENYIKDIYLKNAELLDNIKDI